MKLLLDTNVLSELRRLRPEQKVIDFLAGQRFKDLYVSVATLAELRFGILTLDDPIRRADLSQWLAHDIRPIFETRTLNLDEDVMLRWKFLVHEGRKIGRTFAQPDLLIAATALEHNLMLVTRNVKDFAGLDLKILNPWQPEA